MAGRARASRVHRVGPDAFLARGAFHRDRRHVFGSRVAVSPPRVDPSLPFTSPHVFARASVLRGVPPSDAHGRLAVVRPDRLAHERYLGLLRAASHRGDGPRRARATGASRSLGVHPLIPTHQPRVVVHPASHEVVGGLAARQAVVSLPSEVLDRGEQKSEHVRVASRLGPGAIFWRCDGDTHVVSRCQSWDTARHFWRIRGTTFGIRLECTSVVDDLVFGETNLN